jgi:uncharacterized protein (DUF1330 family)
MNTETTVPVYALAYLREVDFGEDIVEYLQRIDETLAPFGGRFLVHGGPITPLEGTWDGDVVVIAFPDRSAATDWYESPAYQEIIELRTRNSHSIAAVVDGVPTGYRAVDGLADMLAQR